MTTQTLNEMRFTTSVYTDKLSVYTRGRFFRVVDENALKRSKLKSAHGIVLGTPANAALKIRWGRKKSHSKRV